jgi:hypothetical protein
MSDRQLVAAHVDSADREQLVALARREERSVSAEIRVAIREHLRTSAAMTIRAEADAALQPASEGS